MIIILVSIAAIAGIVYSVYSVRKNKVRVEVEEVSTLDWGNMDWGMGGYGQIISDGSQSIFLSQEEEIKEILVTEGQTVAIGDPLLSYDMTRATIQFEMKKLELEKVEYEIAIAQSELKGLLLLKPIIPTVPSSPIPPLEDDPGEDDPELPSEDPPVIIPPEPEPEPEGFTAQEIAKKIYEKKKQIQDFDLRLRIGKLEIISLTEVVSSGVVTAKINGVVKKVRDPEEGNMEWEPLIFLSQSEGLYLYGSLTELQLIDVKIGQIVMCNSWQTGTSFEAEIKEIEDFPNPIDRKSVV